jgi:hypothetical protein
MPVISLHGVSWQSQGVREYAEEERRVLQGTHAKDKKTYGPNNAFVWRGRKARRKLACFRLVPLQLWRIGSPYLFLIGW